MNNSLNWKANNDINSNKNKINQIKFHPEEEEPFIEDNYQLREICSRFVKNPYPNLKNLHEISDILVEANQSLIEYLREINFFKTFGHFINSVSEPIDKIASLQILLNLTRLPTNVCLDLIDGYNLALNFLKLQIFSNIDDIRYLSLKCLKHFAQDSHACRILILFYRFLFDLYSILIGNKNDIKTISLVEKNITFLLLEELKYDDILILRKTAFDLIQQNFGTDISCRILCSLSEKINEVDKEFIAKAPCLIQFLINAKDAKCLKYLMKFFFIRLGFLEEATNFFSNGLLKVLYEVFLCENMEGVDSFNINKIDWSCKLIGKIIENVSDSIYQFFEIGVFDVILTLNVQGNYNEKSSSVYVLSRVLLKVEEKKIKLDENQITSLHEIIPYCIELLDTIDQNTIHSVLDFILSLIRIRNYSEDMISLLSQTENFNNISIISTENENEILRGKAAEIINIIQSYN